MGSPSDVYERPATPFVANFVGTSNLLSGDAARQILGRDGTFSVRPERIRVVAPQDSVGADEDSALGVVREVIYAGAATRLIVDLNAGASLIAVQQNVRASSMDAMQLKDAPVRLVWGKECEYQIA